MGLCLDCWNDFFNGVSKELYREYKTDVLDCHPFNTPVPISFKNWVITR